MSSNLHVLVTGGAGYIGSHTCKLLHKEGYTPVVFDNLSTGDRNLAKWGVFIHGDILRTAAVIDAIKEYEPVAVIHFAASAYVGESVVDPSKYYRNNVGGTLSLLEAMRITGLEKIIFSSTCATYGEPEEMPIRETCRQEPINPYGRSKLMIEKMLADFENAYSIKHVALRYFNAAGADPEGDIGENHDPETHIIPLILNAASTGKEFKVFGNDYDTFDGTCVRDYIHVNDLASAHVKALNYLLSNMESDQFNLGNGQGYSVNQIIESVKKATGKNFPVKIENRRPGDPPVLIGDNTKVRKILNWKPSFTEIDEVILTAWNWFQRK
jgi:UDP-glucose-4-epimerase GalE